MSIAKQPRGSVLPLLWVFLFAALLVYGATSGVMLANTGADTVLHDTYYMVAHVRDLVVLAVPISIFTVFYVLAARIVGLQYNQALAWVHYVLTLFGVAMRCAPTAVLSLQGMPQRFVDYETDYSFWNTVSTIGAAAVGIGVLVFLALLFDIARVDVKGGGA